MQLIIAHTSKGFTLIEVLVTFLITTVGLLGLAALQVNTMNDQFEAIQRAQITAMVDDMAARIRMNPAAAGSGAYAEDLLEGTGGILRVFGGAVGVFGHNRSAS